MNVTLTLDDLVSHPNILVDSPITTANGGFLDAAGTAGDGNYLQFKINGLPVANVFYEAGGKTPKEAAENAFTQYFATVPVPPATADELQTYFSNNENTINKFAKEIGKRYSTQYQTEVSKLESRKLDITGKAGI
ncbi:MAG: hypothetical protein WC393_02300 [Candidatus Nanoarchaeia archaeon]|jgi:hypothetical protein